MPNLTTNFSLNKPLVNNATDQDLWGGYLNDNFDTIDTQLLLCRDWKKRVITAADVMVLSDRHKMLLCDATIAPFAETLPSAATAGDGFEFTAVKTDSSGHAVTLTPVGADTIGSNATWPLTGQGDAATLVADGIATWSFKGNKTTPSAVASASTTVSGILMLATNALALAGVDATTALTPAALASLATATASGKLVIGPLTFQWGSYAGGSSNGTILFPTPFSNTPFFCDAPLTIVGSYINNVGGIANNGFNWLTQNTNNGSFAYKPFNWFAIGPT